jgi:large subunit ribosomal protein L18
MRKQQGKIKDKSEAKRYRRRLKIRETIIGSSEKPRVSVFKSNRHFFVQIIDDQESKTLFSVQTYGKNAVPGASSNKEGAKAVGAMIAKNLKEKNISKAVFDRAGYRFHGVLAIMVDSMRENGIAI